MKDGIAILVMLVISSFRSSCWWNLGSALCSQPSVVFFFQFTSLCMKRIL